MSLPKNEILRNAKLVNLFLGSVPIDGQKWEIRVRVDTSTGGIDVDPKVKIFAVEEDGEAWNPSPILRRIEEEQIREILEEFRYQSTRPFVGRRPLPSHSIGPLARFIVERGSGEKGGDR